MKDHFFVSDSDGGLYDTRPVKWASGIGHLVRADYRRTFRNIKTAAQFKATLRNGAYAWPGGYPMFLLCSDGAALCFDCGKSQLRYILPSIRDKANDGWQVVATDINYEDSELYCDHCSKQIESAYGESSEEESR